DVTNAQATFWRSIIYMRVNKLGELGAEPLAPTAMFFEYGIGIVIGLEIERIEKVAGHLSVVGSQLHGESRAVDGRVEIPLLLVSDAQVVVGFGKIRLQFQGAAVAGDGVIQVSLISEGVSEVVIRLDTVWLQREGALAGGQGIFEPPQIFESGAQV